MIRVFCGYDPREAMGFHVFTQSLIEYASEPIAIIPLYGQQRDGTNLFTYARFLVPSLCDFKGMAIFVDGTDMLMREDITKLAALYDPKYAVQAVKHDYKTGSDRKYIGTMMEAKNENYRRKNWSSVIIWNCGHIGNRRLDTAAMSKLSRGALHRFYWLNDDEIGELPADWNLLVREQSGDAKIAHFTLGIPSIPEYANDDFAGEWRLNAARAFTSPAASSPFTAGREPLVLSVAGGSQE